MKKQPIIAAALCLWVLSACTAADPVTPDTAGSGKFAIRASVNPYAEILHATPAAPSPTDTATRTKTAAPSPTATLTFTPSRTPTLAPDAWQSMPVVPVAGENARRVYHDGLGFGNDPYAFSILGDCLSLPLNFLGNFGRGPSHYNLGDYTYLQPVIEWFEGSFTRQSASLGDGFTTAAVLSPLRADPKRCEKDETPMVCEYRIHRPVIALIALGTDDYMVEPETYAARMREILEYTLSSGVVPILATKADNREGNNAFNRIVAALAYEYGMPLWNFWAAAQPLPNHGLRDNRGHLTWADPDDFSTEFSKQRGMSVHSLTFLQSLYSVWRGVTDSAE